MPWNDRRRRPNQAGRAALAILVLMVLLAGAQSPQRARETAPAPEEKQLSVYGPRVSYSLPVSERNGQDYVALLEALEPFGNVSAGVDGQKWKLHFGKLEAEFRRKASAGKVAGKKFELPAAFLLEGDRGLVPLRALPSILSRMLGTKADYHEAARRLFLGGAATHFTTDPRENELILNFTAPVNPLISTEPGKLKMTFTRDPVVGGSYVLRLENPLVSSVTFAESNGRGELTVLGRLPLLAQFAPGGKTIDIVAAPRQARSLPPSTPPGLPEGAPPVAAPATVESPPVTVPAPPTLQSLTAKPPFVVMLDAAHGGDDPGALLSETLEEKAV
ncbi:MAG TPA: hypothetical protein VEC95_02245, partial [Terriglobales bacterium]|nr:hypothetical protein [Terriglobales bacterium]